MMLCNASNKVYNYCRVRSISNEGVKSNYLLHFPDQFNLYDIDWIALISKRRRTMLSRLLVDSDSKLSIPKAEVIGRIEGRNGLSSSSVVILDAKTVMINDFTFKALAPNTYFWAGTGFEPDQYGEPLSVDGRTKALGRKNNETLLLELPKGKTIHDIDYIGLYSKTLTLSLAHVKIPPNLIVPPSPDDLGIKAETELNCERLSVPQSQVDLELRWSITTDEKGEDVIIMQLVSSSNSDRYIALGIRLSDQENLESSKAAGDVIVGWINSKSGKGGIGDYFLAKENGEFTCSDGAESCPDNTFDSGKENVVLLNSVYRENYTMLTVQRSLNAKDEFDVNINLDAPQNVFWSIGYKSPYMRRSNPPMKNKAPIQIDFGRRPFWNCPKDNEIGQTSDIQYDENNELFINEPSNENEIFSNEVIDRSFESEPKTVVKRQHSWNVPAIDCSDSSDGGLFVQLGGATPTKGNPDLKVAMYVNGLAAPDIYLTRGKEVTFVVETGSGTNRLGLSHPFYITTDPEGGFGSKGDFDRSYETVYAGVNADANGNLIPVGLGRLCLWRSPQPAQSFQSYKDYHLSGLRLECPGEHDPGKNHSGVYTFLPNENMPDVLYYHSYFAKNVGGRLFLTDHCDIKAYSKKEGEVLTTFRPKLSEGTDAELKKMKEKNDKERELSLLQSLLEAREERTRKKRKQIKTKTTKNEKKRCLRKRMGQQQRYKRSPFNFDAKMPVFPNFPQRDDDWPSSSSEIHYQNGQSDFDRIDSSAEEDVEEDEENCIYDDEIVVQNGDSLYNMDPFEDVPSTVQPPPWTKYWDSNGPTGISSNVEPTHPSPSPVPAIVPQRPKEQQPFSAHAPDVFGQIPSAITVTTRPSFPFSSDRERLPDGQTFIDSPSSFQDIEKLTSNNEQNIPWNNQDFLTAPTRAPTTISTSKFYFTTSTFSPPVVTTARPSYPLSHQSDPNKLNNGYLFSPKPRIKKHQSNKDYPHWVKHQPSTTTQRPFTASAHPATHFNSPHNNNRRPSQPVRPPPPKTPSFPLFSMKNPFAQLMSPFSSVLEPTNKWLFGRGEPKKPPQQQQNKPHRVITTQQPRLLSPSPTPPPAPARFTTTKPRPLPIISTARPHFPPKAPSNPIPKRPLQPNPRRSTKIRKPQGLPGLFRLPLLPAPKNFPKHPKRPIFHRRPQQPPNVRRFIIAQQQQQPSQRRASITPQFHPALVTTAMPVQGSYTQVKRGGIQIREKGLEGIVASQGIQQEGGGKRKRRRRKKRKKKKQLKKASSTSPVFATTPMPLNAIKRSKLSPAPSNRQKPVFPRDEMQQRPRQKPQSFPRQKNFQVPRHNRGKKNFFIHIVLHIVFAYSEMINRPTFLGPPRRSYQKIQDFRHALLGEYYGDNDDMMMAVSPSEIVEVERRMEPTTTMTPMTYGPSNKRPTAVIPVISTPRPTHISPQESYTLSILAPTTKNGFSPSDSAQNSLVFSGIANPNPATSNGFVPVEIETPNEVPLASTQQEQNAVYSSIPQLAFNVNELTVKNYSASSQKPAESMMPMYPSGAMPEIEMEAEKGPENYFYYDYLENENEKDETGMNSVLERSGVSSGEADFYEFEEYPEQDEENEDDSYYYFEEYEDKDSLDDAGSQPLMFDLLVGADLSGGTKQGNVKIELVRQSIKLDDYKPEGYF